MTKKPATRLGLLIALCALPAVAAFKTTPEDREAAPTAANPFVGTWKGFDKVGRAMLYRLGADGKLELEVTEMDGRFTRTGTYRIDTSTTPAQFDVHFSDGRELRTICRLIDASHLAFENVDGGERRPLQFGRRRIVLFRR